MSLVYQKNTDLQLSLASTKYLFLALRVIIIRVLNNYMYQKL